MDNRDGPSRRLDAWVVPSRVTAVRYGLVGLALIVATTLIEVAVHGLDVESWGSISGTALVLVPAWSGVTNLARYRSDRRREWLFVAIGSFGWAFGQLLWIAQITLNGSTTWPSFLRHRLSRVAHRGDRRGGDPHPAVRAIYTRRVHGRCDGVGRCPELRRLGADHSHRCRRPGTIFVAVAAGDADLSAHRHRFRVNARAVVVDRPVAGTHRSVRWRRVVDRRRYGLFGIGATRRPNTSSFAVPWPCWVLGFGVVALSAGLPSGAVVRYTRPTLSRLLVVHLPVMAAVWLAAWRYMLHDKRGHHRHDRHRSAGRADDHRRAAGHLVPLDDVVGSAQRQHRQPSAYRGGASCACSTTFLIR